MSVKPNYHCAQDELYGACAILGASLDEEQSIFNAFKAKYTSTFISSFLAGNDSAKDMLDDDQRIVEQEIMRGNLLLKLDLCMEKLNALRLYIRDAYETEFEREARWQEAGFGDYAKAMNANWEKLDSIMNSGKIFLNTHEADLLANDNMNAGFKAGFIALQALVKVEIVAMLNTRENTKQGTEAKIIANNAIYERAKNICEDGAFLFMKQQAKKDQFVWSSILELVSPTGKAGLKLTVRDAATNAAIVTAVLRLTDELGNILFLDTDDEGKNEFSNLAAGIYDLVVMHDGYVAYEGKVTLHKGVTSRKLILLLPM